MKRLLFNILISLFLVACVAAQEEEQRFSVIPTPQHLAAKKLQYRITAGTKIILGTSSKEEQFAAQQINDELAEWKKVQLKVVPEKSVKKLPASFIFIGPATTEYGRQLLKDRKGSMTSLMKDEGYFLDIDADGVVIIAESERGRFYGVMTLLQLMHVEKRAVVVNGVAIHDYPLEHLRGITDDISRGQVSTVENFKKIIRFLGKYKLNTYSPYLEDMFVFKNHPLIGKGRGALTAADVKELDAYAKKYYIDMIPIFETLGHWENILAKPEYIGFAEFPGAHTLNVSDEKVYAMLDEMIGELCGAFSSQYFNMAADESWDVGLGANKERVAKSDLATVHAEHYKRVVEIIRKYGKKPMMYGDIILNNPTILEKIPQDITIVDWHYGASFAYDSPEVFKKAGFPFIASPAVWNFTGPFPNYLNTFVNIKNFNRNGYENGSIGLLTSNWNDYGGEDLRELNYYGYAWTAECAWQPLKADVESFNRAFFPSYFGMDDCDALRSALAILSSPGNNYNWQELWRHPLLPTRPQSQWEGYLPLTVRCQSINSTMPLVVSLLNTARLRATRNQDQLKYFEFVARLDSWFAKKIETQEQVKQLSSSVADGARKDSVALVIASLCEDVLKNLGALKNEFERLWLATNRPAGLEYILMRYDRQAAFWQEKIDEVKRGDLWVDPVIESAWICHPKGNPGTKDTVQVQKAYFRKTFSSPKGLRAAQLQLIGDTRAKAMLNGKILGEVYVRRSLSLSLEHQKIKSFDILPYLSDSSNVLAVEVETFSPTGSAGVNVYCEMRGADGSMQKILTDSTWKVSRISPEGWIASTFKDSTWTNAVTKTYPWTVVRPNFATGRNSWMER